MRVPRSIRSHRSFLIVTVILVLASAVHAHAKKGYFEMHCATCHFGTFRGRSPGDTVSCAGCHYHGMYSRGPAGALNFKGRTDKPVYEAGEPMKISVTGGDGLPGWVRVALRDRSQRELARATGPTGMGDDSDPNWSASCFPGPIVLEATAPYLPGTYQWEVGYFGNIALPNPAVLTEHQGATLRWHYVPLPTFDVYSNDVTGPSISALTLSPTPTGGVRHLTVSALASDATSGKTPLGKARYRIQSAVSGAPAGPWTPMQALDGDFDGADEPVVAVADLSQLSPGLGSVQVQAADALGNWGPSSRELFILTPPPPGDFSPPTASCGTPFPRVVPSGQPVTVRVVVNDRKTGGSPIHGAEAFVAAPGNDGTGLILSAVDGALDSPREALEGPVPTAGLADGTYSVLLHGVDAAGLWSSYCTRSFEVRQSADTQGPSVSDTAFAPNPTHGASVAVFHATASDVGSGYGVVTGAELILDPNAAPGSGVVMLPADGIFDSPEERLTGVLDVSAWNIGAYTVFVRAKDSRGLWGANSHVSLQVTDDSSDREGPAITGLTVRPSPTNGAQEITLSGMADDLAAGGSTPVAAEYFLGSPGALGSGISIPLGNHAAIARVRAQVDVSSLMPGMGSRGVIYARAMDVHGNWGPLSAVAFWVTPAE